MAQCAMPIGWEELGPGVYLFLRLVLTSPLPCSLPAIPKGPLCFTVFSQLSLWDRILWEDFSC